MSQPDFASGLYGAPSATPGFASLGASAAAGSGPRAAIARAAQATGVDFSYLLAQAKLESSLNPNAKAGTSSAAGLYQFTRGTWAQMLQQHGAEAGLDGAAPGGTLAALHDPAQRARLMALRYDPDTSARMAAELATDNQAALSASLGRTPRPAELYLAHFLGSDGAVKFLSAMAADPAQSAAALLPKAAAANRAVFYDAAGGPRSLGAVMAVIDGRMANAMRDGGNPGAFGSSDPTLAALSSDPEQRDFSMPDPAGAAPAWGGAVAREFVAAQGGMAGGNAGNGSGSALPVPAASMADTLNAAFALGGDGAGNSTAPDFVRTAYGRLRAMGM